MNYTLQVWAVSAPNLFGQLHVLNLFNKFQLCGCGGSVFANGGAVDPDTHRYRRAARTSSNPTLYATFNPFTTTPVQGVNWDYGPGVRHRRQPHGLHVAAELRLTFGVRF